MILIAIKRNHVVVNAASLVLFACSFIAIFFLPDVVPHTISILFTIDRFGLFYLGLFIAASFFVTLLAFSYFQKRDYNREEFYLLLFLACLGSSVLAISSHFISFLLALEILSVSLYGLIAYSRAEIVSIEAGLKYLVLAAASSAFLLFGMALIYAETGTMEFSQLAKYMTTGSSNAFFLAGLALTIVGFGFKLAVAPFHMWTPDVYQGAPAPVTAFIATVSKGGVLAILLRFFAAMNTDEFYPAFILFSIIAIASMFIGNILALRQENVKRILAYSSIAHLGYILVAFLAGQEVGLKAATFYILAYTVTTLGAFGIISVLSTSRGEPGNILEFRSLFWQRPFLAIVFTAMLLSLAGIPLTAGFLAKFFVLAAGVRSALWVLLFSLVINSAIGLYYYLRIVVAMYTQSSSPGENPTLAKTSISGGLVLIAMLILLIWLGVFPGVIYSLINTFSTI